MFFVKILPIVKGNKAEERATALPVILDRYFILPDAPEIGIQCLPD